VLKVEGLEKRLGLGLARSRSWSCLVAEIRRLGLVSVSWNCRKVLVSVSSRRKNRMSQSRKLRSRLHPWIFGRLFVKRFALCFWTIVCPVCPVCDIGVLWPNGWMDEDETWHAGRHRPWPDYVTWGPSSPSPKMEQSPQFLAHVYCGQAGGWIKIALGLEVGLGSGHIVVDGDSAPLPKNGTQPPPIFGPCLLWPNGCRS